MQKKWMSLVSIMFLVIVSGCQGQNERAADERVYDLRKDTSQHNNMYIRDNDGAGLNTKSDRGQNKQHMVEDDITNQNPNFLDLKRTGSGSEAGATNHGNDINQAKQVIADTNEFKTDSVWINGDRMWVTVYKKGMLTDKEKNDAEARLHRKLVKALPRYNIEVRVQEDRR